MICREFGDKNSGMLSSAERIIRKVIWRFFCSNRKAGIVSDLMIWKLFWRFIRSMHAEFRSNHDWKRGNNLTAARKERGGENATEREREV